MKLRWAPVLLIAADMLAMLLAFAGGYFVAKEISSGLLGLEFMPFIGGPTTAWIWIYLAVATSVMVLFGSRGHYTQRSPWWEQVKYMTMVCATMMLLAGTTLYMLKLPFSRMWVLWSFVLAVPLLMILRLLVRRICLAMGQWGADVAIVGGPENVLETIFALSSDFYNVYRVKEVYLLGTKNMLDKQALPAKQRGSKQMLARTEILAGLVKKSSCELFIAAPDEATRLDMAVFKDWVDDRGGDVAFVPPMTGMSLYGMDVQHFFGSHTVLLKPKRRVEKRLNRVLKRGLDLFGASCGLLVLGIPMLVVAYLIRKDGGPALYYQPRVGYKGKTFKCWKLRSMVPNAGEVLAELLKNDAAARAEYEADFKLKNDPRITRIGHIIRKTSIDELPQLWSVIRGDMSLVGPRPIVTKELEYYGKNKADYLAAKPGCTGLWQVSGRNDTSYAYRVYLDTWYVAHWSVWTDIVIIIQTVGIMITRKGAY